MSLSTAHQISELLLLPAKVTTKRKADTLVAWANAQTRRCNSLLREIGQRIRLAKEIKDLELLDLFEREWTDLEKLAEDLQTPALVIKLYANRAAIEALLADAEPDKPPEPFPELTEEYLERLRKLVMVEI